MANIAKPRKRAVDYLIAGTNSVGELLFIYFVMVVLAGAGFSYFEHKPFGDALWWAVVTTTTTGYGDFTPVSWPGRIIAAVVMLSSILLVLPLLIGHVAMALIENRDAFTHEEQEQMKADLAGIRSELAKLNASKLER